MMLSVLILMMFLSLLPTSSPAPGVVLTAASLTEDTGEMLGDQQWDDVHFSVTETKICNRGYIWSRFLNKCIRMFTR